MVKNLQDLIRSLDPNYKNAKNRLCRYMGRAVDIELDKGESFIDYLKHESTRLDRPFQSQCITKLRNGWNISYVYEMIRNIEITHQETKLDDIVDTMVCETNEEIFKDNVAHLHKTSEKIFCLLLLYFNPKEYHQFQSIVSEYIHVEYPEIKDIFDAEGELSNGFIWKFRDGENLFISGDGVLNLGIVYTERPGSYYDKLVDKENYYFPIDDRIKGQTKRIFLSGNISKIGDGCFAEFSTLESVRMPHTVEEIGVSAFQNCVQLRDIVLWTSVTKIGVAAFRNCVNLQKVVLHPYCQIGGYAFSNCLSIISVNNDVSTGIYAEIKIPSSEVYVEQCAFSGCLKLKDVKLVHIREISYGAFENTHELKQIFISFVSNGSLGAKLFVSSGAKKVFIQAEKLPINRKTFSQIKIRHDTFWELEGIVIFWECIPIRQDVYLGKLETSDDFKMFIPANISKYRKNAILKWTESSRVKFAYESDFIDHVLGRLQERNTFVSFVLFHSICYGNKIFEIIKGRIRE